MILRGVAGQHIGFILKALATGKGLPNVIPTCVRSGDGAPAVPVTGVLNDKGAGQYILTMSIADCNFASVSFVLSFPGALSDEKTILPFDPLAPPPSLVGPPGPPGPPGPTGPTGPAAAWQGVWSGPTTYSQYDAVSFGGSSYISLGSGNVGNQPDTSPAQWALLAAAGVSSGIGPFDGAWAGGTIYGSGNVVTFGGSTYTSLASGNVANQPDTSPAWWALLAAAGATGPPGPTGPTMTVGGAIAGGVSNGLLYEDVGGNLAQLAQLFGPAMLFAVSGSPVWAAIGGDLVLSTPGVLTLADVGTPGTYGDAYHTLIVQVDAAGRVTSVTADPVQTTAALVDYTDTVPADWGGTSPVFVQSAIDRLAAWVALNFPGVSPP